VFGINSILKEAFDMNDELKGIVIASLFGAIGFMWVVGGIALVLAGFEEHWALGWLSLFIWVWGCTAVALYFKVQRFFP
jgi:hypothetical protein